MTALSDTQAEALARHRGNLHLHGLTSISDAQAEALAKLTDWLNLSGLTTLSDAQAAALANYRGRHLSLSLRNPTKMSPAARSLLEANPRIKVYEPSAPASPRPGAKKPPAVL